MSKEIYLPTYEGCFVCGQKDVNPNTLNRRFKVTETGVEVTFKADYRHAGYAGIVHGGIITALLDETIGWAVAVDRKKLFVTGELTVRFVRPLPIGLEVVVRGHSREHKSRYSIAEGEMTDANGLLFAKASGKFFLMKDKDAQKVDAYLNYKKDDFKVLMQ
ncbi:PaaI family thioesterase [candidate division KSB1 bacterium]|nr:PaaI family thioesterase [candidate division KSB1 bacterium]RQW00704.1 MAG: PaaI family thioesterase [candidate division KSB1 bacterium]